MQTWNTSTITTRRQYNYRTIDAHDTIVCLHNHGYVVRIHIYVYAFSNGPHTTIYIVYFVLTTVVCHSTQYVLERQLNNCFTRLSIDS